MTSETQALHREVEGVLRVMADDFSAHDYLEYLASFFGFYALSQRLPEAVRANRFFSVYGDRIGPMWRAMGESIETSTDPNETVDAARETFRALTPWLTASRGARAVA
ncbi:MAG: hypothetical protein JNK82_27755 [Myxococcaceae bacterium]|nr:hypothetical protein [Myxococcaceae bacterium]